MNRVNWKRTIGLFAFGSVAFIPSFLLAAHLRLITDIFGGIGLGVCIFILLLFSSKLIQSNTKH